MKKTLLFITIFALVVALAAPVYGSISELYAAKRQYNNEEIRILTIGNSYAVDAQAYLHQIAEAAGVKMTVGIAYDGGCTFRKHMDHYNNNTAAYNYYENGRSQKSGVTLNYVLEQQDWDYITFQLGTEGLDYTVPNTPYLNQLMNILSAKFPDAEMIYNLSWPDGSNSTRKYFKGAFNSDRDAHWAYLIDTAEEAYNDLDIRYITPGGVAYQYAYETYGDNLHRDGYHMSELGRYLNACTWFEFFTGIEAPDYTPAEATRSEGVAPTAAECAVLRACAHRAIETLKEDGGKTLDLLKKDVAWEVDGLRLTGEVKTDYRVGQYFDYTTFKVESTIGNKAKKVEDFTISITEPLKKTDTVVTVSYDGLNIDIPITVK